MGCEMAFGAKTDGRPKGFWPPSTRQSSSDAGQSDPCGCLSVRTINIIIKFVAGRAIRKGLNAVSRTVL